MSELNGYSLSLADIVDESVVDGNGIRMTLFVQGCPHRCKGCHNPTTWPSEGGKQFSLEFIAQHFSKNPLLDGMTFSGGEPFEQAKPLSVLAKWLHSKGCNVWTYSGYTLEELLASGEPDKLALLDHTDVLVDGRYEEDKRNLMLRFRGSENQRLIDLKKTRATNYTQIIQIE